MLFSALVLLCLAGCLGSPTQRDYRQIASVASVPRSFVEEPKLIETHDFAKELNKYLTNGWTLIGKSEYNGNFPSRCDLKKQARKVGATAVLYSGEFITSRSDVSTFGVPETDSAFRPFAYAYPQPYYAASRPLSSSPSQTITTEFDVFEVHEAFLTR